MTPPMPASRQRAVAAAGVGVFPLLSGARHRGLNPFIRRYVSAVTSSTTRRQAFANMAWRTRSRRRGFGASAGPASRTRSLAPRVCFGATGFSARRFGERGTIPAALGRPKHEDPFAHSKDESAATFPPGTRMPTVTDRNRGFQAMTSNRNVSDLSAWPPQP
jgi:hypothetical protein